MPGAHATLSPSSSTRWISCPASVQAIAALPKREEESSPYAQEGTIAHALGEIEAGLHFKLITKRKYNAELKKWRAEFDAEEYADGTLEEMQGHVQGYVDYIQERMTATPGGRLLLEQRMDSGVPGSWGTSDAVIFSEDKVEIIDLKYGAGVPVSAMDNSQLRLYGCGALDTYGDLLGDTEVVRVAVYQPRVGSVTYEEMAADELRAWRTDVALPAADLALNAENPPFGPSPDACRWCPLAGICRARIEKATMEDFGDILAEEEPPAPKDPDMITEEELGRLLHRLPEIKAWATAVEARALESAYGDGKHIPGWKVVMSGGKRSINDHAAAIQLLIDEGYKAEQVADFKAKALGTLEKLVGKQKLPELMGDMLTKSRGKESLVPESDARVAISPTSGAAEDFADEQ